MEITPPTAPRSHTNQGLTLSAGQKNEEGKRSPGRPRKIGPSTTIAQSSTNVMPQASSLSSATKSTALPTKDGEIYFT